MVKLHDAKTNKDVAVVVDERLESAWLADASVDPMSICRPKKR
jgi:hypothetical protein